MLSCVRRRRSSRPPGGAAGRRGATGGSFGPPSVHDQQAQDLIMAAMLAGIGLLVACGHSLLARFVAGMPGGSPAWIVRGTPIVLIVLTGLAGFLSLIYAGY